MRAWTTVRDWLTAGAILLVVACGSESPTTPQPPPSPPPAPAVPSNSWSISGTVSETVSWTPIANASVAPAWNLAAVTADAGGLYNLGSPGNPATTPYELSVSAPGYLTRKIWVTWSAGPRAGVDFDLIREGLPFSPAFYGQFVRGNYDQGGGPWPVMRLPVQPTFYLRTVDQNGRALEPEVLAVISNAISWSVPAFTGGRYAGVIETGTEPRSRQTGWINVNVIRNAEDDRTCGWAYIGATNGKINLHHDICACGSVKVSGHTMAHEVGHALGFFHVDDTRSVMYPTVPGRCPAGELSQSERYHAAIAYSRPRGNTDPDNDPSTGPHSTSGDIRIASPRVRN